MFRENWRESPPFRRVTMNTLGVRWNPFPPPPYPGRLPWMGSGGFRFRFCCNMFQRFSLGHKHKHKNIRTRIMAYFTRFSIPALLNPTINKMEDEASAIVLSHCCFWYVCMRSGPKWPMIGPRPCTYARAYVDPVFTSQAKRKTNLSVFLVLTLMLMWRQFSLAY